MHNGASYLYACVVVAAACTAPPPPATPREPTVASPIPSSTTAPASVDSQPDPADNPMGALSAAEAAARAGDYEKALRGYESCIRHCMEQDPAFIGILSGSLPFDLKRLADRYPAADTFMKEERDRLEARIVEHRATHGKLRDPTDDDVMLFCRMNEELGDEARSVALYDRFIEDADALGGTEICMLAVMLFDNLYAHGRFADIARHKTSFIRRLPRGRMEIPEDDVEAPIVRREIERSVHFYEALARTGDTNRMAVVDRILTGSPDSFTILALVDAATKAKVTAEARSIYDKGSNQLPVEARRAFTAAHPRP